VRDAEKRAAEAADQAEESAHRAQAAALVSWLLVFLQFVAALLGLGLGLSGCSRVCAKTWETGASVEHSVLYGRMYGTHVTVGGEIGQSCQADKTEE